MECSKLSKLNNPFLKEVEAGAKLLDEKKPDWWDLSDSAIAAFDMAEPCGCILGNNYEGYLEGLDALGIRNHNSYYSPAAYGFHIPYQYIERCAEANPSMSVDDFDNRDAWQFLKLAWLAEIEKRQDQNLTALTPQPQP